MQTQKLLRNSTVLTTPTNTQDICKGIMTNLYNIDCTIDRNIKDPQFICWQASSLTNYRDEAFIDSSCHQQNSELSSI